LTAAEFIADFPEFDSEKSAVIDRHIAYADEFFDEGRWGGYLARGLGNWVAHSIVMEKRRKAAGPVAMAGDVVTKTLESPAGRTSVSRGADSVGRLQANPYLESQYGKEYVRLRDEIGMGGVAV